MNLREQYQGICLGGLAVLWAHQSLLCFQSKFNIRWIIPQILPCHIQFSPLSLTHTPPLLLAQIKVSAHYCRFKQLLCSPVACTVIPTTAGSHTSGNWCSLTSLSLLYLRFSVCHFRSSWQQIFLQYQRSPSVSLNELWEISLSQFYILEAVF